MPDIFILSAPSGAGKTSLAKAIIEKLPDVAMTISHTTREKRPSERNGVHYHFVDKTQFEQMIENNEFIEYATVFGNHYGTSLRSISDVLNANKHAILDIDWQGARIVREKFPLAKSIFIEPPSLHALETRLKNRGQDSPKVIAQRMQEAKSELSHKHEYDYSIINDDFSSALAQLIDIIQD